MSTLSPTRARIEKDFSEARRQFAADRTNTQALVRLNTLKSVRNMLQEVETEGAEREGLNEEAVVALLRKQVRSHKAAAASYDAMGAFANAGREGAEADLISGYLPTTPTEDAAPMMNYLDMRWHEFESHGGEKVTAVYLDEDADLGLWQEMAWSVGPRTRVVVKKGKADALELADGTWVTTKSWLVRQEDGSLKDWSSSGFMSQYLPPEASNQLRELGWFAGLHFWQGVSDETGLEYPYAYQNVRKTRSELTQQVADGLFGPRPAQ